MSGNTIMKLGHSLLLLAVSVPLLQAALKDPVRTTAGLVQGELLSGVTAFKGIPFAAPPIGDLRWRAPQPAAT